MSKIKGNELVRRRDLDGTVEAILAGMGNMFEEQNKINEQKFATKEDLERFATKEDLQRETGFVRDDISGLKGDLSTTVSKREFNQLKSRVTRLESNSN